MNINESVSLDLSKLKNNQKNDLVIKNRKIKILTKASVVMKVTLISLILLTVYGFLTFDYKGNFLDNIASTLSNFKVILFEPHFNHFGLAEALYQVGITLGLAFLTTLLGSIIALVLGLFAAQNLSTKWASNLIKGFVALIRAVPTVLWVLIFAVAAGLGSVAAVIGMTFHTVGYLIKAYSESFEELDKSVIEALKGSGANWWQIVFQAVIPSSISYILSWTFLRFEINFTNAVAMGAAAGAGGIGYELHMASAFYYDLREIGIITYFILALAIVLEMSSAHIKVRLKER